LQVAAETAQPEVDLSLDRAEWYAGELGNLDVGKPGEERQFDRGSLPWRERGQRCPRRRASAPVATVQQMSLSTEA
jgi:hypothetical protein